MLRLPVHLVVLGDVAILGVRVVEGIPHADARHGDLLDAIDHPGLRNAHGLEDGRRDVDEVRVLPAHFALGCESLGPAHDHALVLPAALRTR